MLVIINPIESPFYFNTGLFVHRVLTLKNRLIWGLEGKSDKKSLFFPVLSDWVCFMYFIGPWNNNSSSGDGDLDQFNRYIFLYHSFVWFGIYMITWSCLGALGCEIQLNWTTSGTRKAVLPRFRKPFSKEVGVGLDQFNWESATSLGLYSVPNSVKDSYRLFGSHWFKFSFFFLFSFFIFIGDLLPQRGFSLSYAKGQPSWSGGEHLVSGFPHSFSSDWKKTATWVFLSSLIRDCCSNITWCTSHFSTFLF